MEEKRGFIGPASVYRRVFAFIADLLILAFIVFVPFKSIISKIIPSGYSYDFLKEYILSNDSLVAVISTLFIVFGIIAVIYFSWFEYKIQQTPGKMIFGLHAVPETKISLANYIISNLFLLPVFPFTVLWILDPFYMLTSPKSQTLSQRFTKIIVVQQYSYR